MTFTPINKGTLDWDVPLNAALQDIQNQETAHATGVDSHGDRAWAQSQFALVDPPTVDGFVTATNPFFIAHRGSGGEYTEMTLAAYEGAVAAGATAIEVSCQVSADGTLFAMHDTTLDRMTNGAWAGSSGTWTWAALLERAKVVGTPLLGPGWANQDIPTVKQILDRFMGKVVIFIEAKTSQAIVPLQNLLLKYSNSPRSVVWKMYYTNNSAPWARSHGYKVWGYVDVGTTQSQMDAVDVNIDYWGIPWEAPDSQITATLARSGGKLVIVWEVHRRSEVARLTALGVKGIMCSQYLYCTRSTPVATTNQWFSQVKTPGEIGAAHSDPTYALKWDTGAGTSVVYAPSATGDSVLLGGFCPVQPGAGGYKIEFDMLWPVLPVGTLHAGLYFGAADDAKHRFGVANATGCYRMELRPNAGTMQLYTVASGATSGVQVGADITTSGALLAATWYSYRLTVDPTNVTLARTDSTGWSGTFANTAFRGGYFGIHNGSLTDTATLPRYRNLVVTAI